MIVGNLNSIKYFNSLLNRLQLEFPDIPEETLRNIVGYVLMFNFKNIEESYYELIKNMLLSGLK